jgi:hypothetical protein
MIPRIIGVSSLPTRRRSISSLVTIALEEVPIIPAITKVSATPQSSAQPSARPAPKFRAM